MATQWPSANYLKEPSAIALSMETNSNATTHNNRAFPRYSLNGYNTQNAQNVTGYVSPHGSGYYRSTQGYPMDNSSVSMTSLPWNSMNLSKTGNDISSIINQSTQMPSQNLQRTAKPAPLYPPVTTPTVANVPKTSSSTPTSDTARFCFTDQLPFSPIVAGDLTTELAHFDFFNDASALFNGSDLGGSSLELNYIMSDWNAQRKGASTDIAHASLISLLGDINGSITASDLESSKLKPRQPTMDGSLHLNNQTSIWDSTTSLVEKELRELIQCGFCSKVFKSKNGLSKHLKVCNPEAVRNRYCAICERSFNSERTYKIHKERQHHTVNQCHYCSQIFTTAILLRQHIGTHRIVSKAKSCWKCGAQFPTRYRHRKHVAVCVETSKFVCWKCGRDFPSVFCRRKHIELCLKHSN